MKIKKILICPDSFKGSLPAHIVSKTIAETIRHLCPQILIEELPLADGGEGTAKILQNHGFPKKIKTFACDPLGKVIPTFYYTDISGKRAFIESADVIGISLLKENERDPFKSSSKGLGEVINIALENGSDEITVSLGGSATCDGGKGMLEILKYDKLKKVKINVICDVDNPLLGDRGAVNIFAPQKGAKPQDLPLLEKRMELFFKETLNKGLCDSHDYLKPAGGAAGGLGFAFISILKARHLKGIDFILDILEFEKRLSEVDMIITGEGKLDRQSFMGKVISGVLKIGLSKKIPVIAMAGYIENREELEQTGLTAIYEISDPHLNLNDNIKMENAIINLKKATNKMVKSLIDFQ